MQKTILVTGGAGYIGSHCAKLLSKKRFRVVVYDSLVRGYRDAVKYGEFFQGDIGDRASLDALFTSYPIDAVMHFAAFIAVGESVEKPDLYLTNNYEKTLVLLDAMAAHGVGKFIFSSTSALYGDPQYVPIDENHPLNPVNPYSRSKAQVEQTLREREASQGLQSVVFRYFNAAGADSEGELGERHDPETHLAPLVIRAALGAGKPLSIFGTDYDTPDGTCVRDYIHVNDLCSAHILGLEHLFAGRPSDVFNLGNGNGFSVKEIVATVEKITGKKVPCKYEARRAGDVSRLIANAEKAKRVLGWKTDYPDIRDIIGSALAFQKG